MKTRPGFFRQFKIGVSSYFKSIELLTNKQFFVYFLYILLVSAAVVAVEILVVRMVVEAAEARILAQISLETLWAPLQKAMKFILHTGLHFLFYFLFFTINKYILLIVLSPLMAAISEKAESLLNGKEYPFRFSNLLRDFRRGAIIALRNMFIEFGFLFLGLFVVWIPVLGWFCPLFLFILSCYFYGFSMMDYISERRGQSTSESIRYVKAHKGIAIGNGLIMSLLLAVPYLGVFLAAVLGPVAATHAVITLEKD